MNHSESLLYIGPQKKVSLHFSIALTDGQKIDSTFDKKPATFIYGDESFLPGFEKALTDLKAGDKRSFYLKPEQAFGEHNSANIRIMPKTAFPKDISLEEGLVFSFADPNQAELPGVIKKVSEHNVTVDFNHPLAGKDIHFQVEILEIQIIGAERIANLMAQLPGSEANGR